MQGKQNILFQLLLTAAVMTSCDGGNNGKSADVLADTTSTETLSIESLVDSANNCYDRAEYTNSLALAKESYALAIEADDSAMMAEGLSCMVANYQQMGLLDSAVVAGKELLKIDEAIGDPAYLASDYSNIAAIYLTDKKADDARYFIDRAIELEKTIPGSRKLSIRYGLASEIYNLLELRGEALDFAEQAYRLDWESGDSLKAYRRLSQKGNVLAGMERYEQAKTAYLAAIDGLTSIGEKHSLGISYRQLGAIYLKGGDADSAVEYIQKAIAIASETGEQNMMMQCYELMSDAYEGRDAETALAYNKRYTHLRDSLQTVEKDRQLSQLSIQHKTAEKDSIIKDHETTIRTTWWVVAALISGLMLLAFVLWHMFKRLRYRTKKIEILNKQMQQKQEELERQREEFLKAVNEQPTRDESGSADNKKESEDNLAFIESLNEAIFACMTKTDLTAESVAQSLGLNAQQMRRRIQEVKGMSSKAYIQSVWMEYAKRLLKEKTNLTVAEIAYKCGFDEPAHFTRAFKRETGMTPKEFRSNA